MLAADAPSSGKRNRVAEATPSRLWQLRQVACSKTGYNPDANGPVWPAQKLVKKRTEIDALRNQTSLCIIPPVLGKVIVFCFSIQLAAAAPDRDVAEWVLRWEGHVTIEGRTQPVTSLADLPDVVHITGVDLTPAVLPPRELVKLEGLKDLRELYLPGPIWNPGGGNEDSTEAFKALATLTNVERLAFGWHYNARIEIRDAEIEKLTGWTRLKDLRCSQCSLADVDLSKFSQLENLDLSENPFTNKGMEGLSKLKNLRRLLLRDALITDEGLKPIAGLTNLEELDLSGARITDTGIEYLRNLKAMRRLNLLGAQVTDASMDVIGGMNQHGGAEPLPDQGHQRRVIQAATAQIPYCYRPSLYPRHSERGRNGTCRASWREGGFCRWRWTFG